MTNAFNQALTGGASDALDFTLEVSLVGDGTESVSFTVDIHSGDAQKQYSGIEAGDSVELRVTCKMQLYLFPYFQIICAFRQYQLNNLVDKAACVRRQPLI